MNYTVWDQDDFSKELILKHLSTLDHIQELDILSKMDYPEIDLIIVDPLLSDLDQIKTRDNTQIIVISSNEKFVKKAFKNEITDYISKPFNDLQRLTSAVDKARLKWLEN